MTNCDDSVKATRNIDEDKVFNFIFFSIEEEIFKYKMNIL